MSWVLLEIDSPIATLTLDRVERHNSLVPAFLREIRDAIGRVAAEPGVRVLLLQANGRTFSTGGDALGFVEHADDIEAYAREIVGLLNDVMLALIDLPVPVITAVHGMITGGSIGFVLASDIVLLAPEASFTPFYSVVGPSPDGGWAALLPLRIGKQRAARVLYLNESIDAETAVAWGIANEVIAEPDVREAAQLLAVQICDKVAGSVHHTKRLLNLDRDAIAARLEAERAHFVQQMITAEAIDGFWRFLEGLRAHRGGL